MIEILFIKMVFKSTLLGPNLKPKLGIILPKFAQKLTLKPKLNPSPIGRGAKF